MLVSGFWDWSAGHPTKIRWHAITGVMLAILLLAHTVRRRSRLRRSAVRETRYRHRTGRGLRHHRRVQRGHRR